MWIFLSVTAISFLPGCHYLAHGFTFRSNVGKFYARPAVAVVDGDGHKPSIALRGISSQHRTRRLRSPLFMADDQRVDASFKLQNQHGNGKANCDAVSYDITRYPFESRSESLSTPPPTNTNDQDENGTHAKQDVVKRWLLFHLPKLQPRDVEIYSKRLVEDGFDSAETLTEVVEEDLDFMKVAHQRVLGKKLTKGTDIEKAKGVINALDRLTGSGNNTHEGIKDLSHFMTADEEECEGEECFDITRGTFMERTTQSLSTTRIPSHDSSSDATMENYVARNTTQKSDEYFDITQHLFPERPRSFTSAGFLSTPPKRKRGTRKDIVKSEQSHDEEFFDITQNLFPETPKTSLSTGRLFSAFNEREKSEMNSRPAPRSIEESYFDITKQHFSKQRSSLPQSVNTGTVKTATASSGAAVDNEMALSSSEDTDEAVDTTEKHIANDRTSDYVDTGAKYAETGSEARKDASETYALDSFTDITKQHFTSDRPSNYVNTGTIKQGTTSGLSIESQNNYVTAAQTSNFIDITKQHFSDRSSFSLLVNSGTKKVGTTFGSWNERTNNPRKSLPDGDWLPMSERTKDNSWRRKRNPKSAYLDNPQFSSDLCPPSFAKSGASLIDSRQPLSSTANVTPKQRFNTTGDDYRDTITSTDRYPLSSIANSPPQQRFKTSDEGYKGSSASINRLPLSSTANAPREQRFRTNEKRRQESPSFLPLSSDAVYRRFNPGKRRKTSLMSNDKRPLSVTVHSTTHRFKPAGQKSLLLSTTANLNATSNNFDVPRAFSNNLEMVTRSEIKNASALSKGVTQHIDKINFSDNLSAPSKVKNVTIGKLDATSKLSSKNELPLSMTVHSSTNRFNTTQKSSSSFAGATAANQTVGFDVPRAFIRNIAMVTHSEAKTNSLKSSIDHPLVDDIEFSRNLSSSTKVTNLKKYKETTNAGHDKQNVDSIDFSTNLSAPLISRKSAKSQPGRQTDEVIFVDEKKFSTDLTRLSINKRKPGSAIKSTPHDNDDSGVDLNQFSPVSDLCPPSKLKSRKQSDSLILTAPHLDKGRFLNLSTHHPVNTKGTATTRGSPAVISDDPYVDVPQFSEVLSGSLRIKNLTTSGMPSSDVTKDDLAVDLHQFSPASELCPPSLVKSMVKSALSKDDLGVDRHHFSSVSEICLPSKLKLVQLEKNNLTQNEVMVDRFLDLSSKYTVNNASRTLGSHAVVSDDPYVDRTRFSSDLSPPSKVKSFNAGAMPQYFDITQSSLTTLSRNVSSVRDAISASKVRANRQGVAEYGQTSNEKMESTHDEVESWLLSRLPDLKSDKIEAYAERLVEDGFDSDDMLEELTEDDLSFMEGEHKHSLIINDWLLSHLPDLEDTVVTSYSTHLIDDGFDSLDMLQELTKEDLQFMKTAHMRVLAKYLEQGQASANIKEDDTFVVSVDNECFDITRDSFPARPSLASDPNHHLTRSTKRKPVVSQVFETSRERIIDENVDITRDSFPHRPPLFEAHTHHMSLSLPERSRRVENMADQSFGVVSSMDVPSAHAADPIHNVSKKASQKRGEVETNEERHNEIIVDIKAPRAELYQFYIKKGFTSEQASEIKDFYTVWTNDALPHEKMFTCVFTCPISGEHFFSRNWEEKGEVDPDGQVYWYKTKKAALNAAAANALACLALHDYNDTGTSLLRICQDTPSLSLFLPPDVVLPSPRFRLEDTD